MSASFDADILLTMRSLFLCSRYDEIHIYNAYLFTPFHIFLARLLGCHVVFYSHEPAKKGKYKSYGFQGAVKSTAVELINKLSIMLAHKSFVFSPYALKLTQDSILLKLFSNKIYETRLLMPDPVVKNSSAVEPTVLFFGQLNKTKTPYWVTDFVQNSKFLQSGGKLKILTGSLEYDFLDVLQRENPSKFEIERVQNLSDEKIECEIQKVIVTVHLHHCVCQSGAMVESYRNRVPIITLEAPGFSQFYDPDCMAMISAYSAEDLDNAISKMVDLGSNGRENAYQFYKKNFQTL